MPRSAYSKSARKTQAAFKKTYGSRWKRVYYATANKISGGRRGKNRGAKAANAAFKKGGKQKRRGRGKKRG